MLHAYLYTLTLCLLQMQHNNHQFIVFILKKKKLFSYYVIRACDETFLSMLENWNVFFYSWASVVCVVYAVQLYFGLRNMHLPRAG